MKPLRLTHVPFKELLNQQSAEIAHIPLDTLRQMMPSLRKLEASLSEDLSDWLTEHRWNEMLDRWGGIRKAQALAQVRNAIREGTKRTGETALEVGRAARDPLVRSGLTLTKKGIDHLAQLIDARAKVAGQWVKLDLNVAALFDKRRPMLIEEFKDSAKRYGQRAISQIRNQFQVGILENQTYSELTNRLMALGRKPGELVPITGDRATEAAKGLYRQQRNNAERLVRTEGMEAYNGGQEIALREAERRIPGLQEQWDSAHDARVCDVCRDLDGEVRDIGAKFSDGSDHPPSHPHCRCTLVPYHKDWT